MKPIAITIGTQNGQIIARADQDAEKNGQIQNLDFVKTGRIIGRITRIEDAHDYPTDFQINQKAKLLLRTQSQPDEKTQAMLYKKIIIEPMGEICTDGELTEYQGGAGYFAWVTKAQDEHIERLYPLTTGLKIGNIASGYKESKVAFYLSDSALQRHIAVFGKNGSGKTNFLKELIAANLEQKTPIPMLVFGHPDIGLDNPNDNGTKGLKALADERISLFGYQHTIKLSTQELNLSDIFDQFDMSTSMKDLWHYVQMKEPQRYIEILARYDINTDPLKLQRRTVKDPQTKKSTTVGVAPLATIDAVCKQARILANYIDSQASPVIAGILGDLKRGKTVLVNTFNMTEYYQGLFIRLLLSRLQRAGKHAMHKVVSQRFLVMIDEAQHFIKMAGEKISEFVMECRKFGVTLLLSTQTPKSIPDSVYGQIYSTVAFHMNKADLKILTEYSPVLEDCKAIIQQPPLKNTLGTGIVQAAGYPYPAVIKVPRFERRLKPKESIFEEVKK
jgi:hypothetical protein